MTLSVLSLILLLQVELLSKLEFLSQTPADYMLHQIYPPASCWHDFTKDNLNFQ